MRAHVDQVGEEERWQAAAACKRAGDALDAAHPRGVGRGGRVRRIPHPHQQLARRSGVGRIRVRARHIGQREGERANRKWAGRRGQYRNREEYRRRGRQSKQKQPNRHLADAGADPAGVRRAVALPQQAQQRNDRRDEDQDFQRQHLPAKSLHQQLRDRQDGGAYADPGMPPQPALRRDEQEQGIDDIGQGGDGLKGSHG
jgi:hypothetical protein